MAFVYNSRIPKEVKYDSTKKYETHIKNILKETTVFSDKKTEESNKKGEFQVSGKIA